MNRFRVSRKLLLSVEMIANQRSVDVASKVGVSVKALLFLYAFRQKYENVITTKNNHGRLIFIAFSGPTKLASHVYLLDPFSLINLTANFAQRA